MPHETFFNLPEGKRQLVVDVAAHEFAEKGYSGASIAQIARRAGIAKGSIYQYFENKADLYLYLLELAGQARLKYAHRALGDFREMPLFDMLEQLLLVTMQFGRDNPSLLRLCDNRTTDVPAELENVIHERFAEAGHEYYAALLEKAMAKGQVRPDLDVEIGSTALFSLILGFGEYFAANQVRQSPEECRHLIRQFVDILRRGLGPAGASEDASQPPSLTSRKEIWI